MPKPPKTSKTLSPLHSSHLSRTSSLPLISVIIPIYNTASTLEHCFQSVVQQTYSNLEIILVDDGSTNDAGELADRLATQDVRAIVIHQSNQGLSAARNAGLKLAHGDYLTFVDSDDTIQSRLLETLYSLIQKYQVKLSICSFTEVFPDGNRRNFAESHPLRLTTSSVESHLQKTTNSDHIPTSEAKLPTIDALVHMLCEDGFTMSAWGKLYARSLFQGIEFPVGKLYEDVGTTYRLILKCDAVAYSSWSGYDYYQGSNSIIHQSFRSQKLDLIALTDQMCDTIATSPTYLNATSSEREFLAFALKKRRLHARFSILRQLTGRTPEERQLRRELTRYIRLHASDVLKNPLRTRRDVIATRATQISPHLFLLLWKLSSYHK